MTTTRIKTMIPAEPSRGRRHRDSTVKCWRRTVTAVPNPDATTGHDLEGVWLTADREADLEPGTLMVLHDFHGARVRVLLPTGAWFQLGGYVDEGGGWVQELRGRIREMLDLPVAERLDLCRKQWRILAGIDPSAAADSLYPLLARPEAARWLSMEPAPAPASGKESITVTLERGLHGAPTTASMRVVDDAGAMSRPLTYAETKRLIALLRDFEAPGKPADS